METVGARTRRKAYITDGRSWGILSRASDISLSSVLSLDDPPLPHTLAIMIFSLVMVQH